MRAWIARGVILGALVAWGRVGGIAEANPDPLYTFFGDDWATSAFGQALSGGCDINRDGVPDVVIAGGQERIADGHELVYVFSGRDWSLLYTLVQPNYDGYGSWDRKDDFGVSVDCRGDIDADGYADILVGASFADEAGLNEGSAYVFSGRDGHLMHTITPSIPGSYHPGFFGWRVGFVKDVNGDRRDEVAIGAPAAEDRDARRFYERGAVEVYTRGGDGRLRLLYRLVPPNDGIPLNKRYFGIAIAAGDANGDGVSDFFIGAPGSAQYFGERPGAVYGYSGRNGTLLSRFVAPTLGTRYGGSVDVADMNGDGYQDIVIGESHYVPPGESEETGRIEVRSGRTGSRLLEIEGGEEEYLGVSVVAEDISHSGRPNILATAAVELGEDDAHVDLHIYSATGALLGKLHGDSDSGFARALSHIGDLNRDKFQDFMISSLPWRRPPWGKVDLYKGTSGVGLSEPVPGIAGQDNTVTANAAEGATVVFVWGTDRVGRTRIPGCRGAWLDFTDPREAGRSVVVNGTASFTRRVSDGLHGRTRRMQAFEIPAEGIQDSGCRVSNLVTFTFR